MSESKALIAIYDLKHSLLQYVSVKNPQALFEFSKPANCNTKKFCCSFGFALAWIVHPATLTSPAGATVARATAVRTTLVGAAPAVALGIAPTLIWTLPLWHRPQLRPLLRMRLLPLMIAWRINGAGRLHWVLRLPVLPLSWQQQLWGLWARSPLRRGAPLLPPAQWGLVVPHFCQVIVEVQAWQPYRRL